MLPKYKMNQKRLGLFNLVLCGLLASLALAAPVGARAAGPVDVLPVRLAGGAVLLNGDWKFRYVPSLDAGADESFYQPAFDVAAWQTIPVPAHWELHGFAEPQYGSEVKEGLGLYRRTFRVAKAWQGQRVFLRFEGVLFGLTAYVNGRQVGEWASSFNPVTFDITDALLPGDADNMLAVRVTTRSKGWDFDTMDCWALSGIFRDVTLFALPPTHFKDYTARPALNPDGTAELQLEVVASGSAGVAGKIISPDGRLVKEFQLALPADGRGSTKLVINQPQLWTAETSSLYRIEMDLQSGGKTLQRFTDRIGLRQVTIENGIFKLNGRPIKLRGIDHHDIWPKEGRVATEELMRRDLELIRDANINFIRTSHYPPHPRFIELCDEMGIYVDCEVPFIHGRKNLSDPAYQDVLLARARATVMRDKNRPSIIFWSVGNENRINELGLNAGRLVKQLDPTRPITFPTMGSHFKTNYQNYPDFVDLYSPHYPSASTIKDYAEKLTRPIVTTEYAHQRGISRGGAGVQDIWEAIFHAPRVAGGAVWLFQDQGILRTAANMKSVENGDLMVWLDEHQYYDTHGYYAVDGIVYSDRTPQIDYWQVRKVYSPVQIQERTLAAKPGEQALAVHVENRFDFRSLAGVKLNWSLCENNTPLQSGIIGLKAKAHETETVSIPVTLPSTLAGDVFVLELRCVDENGRQFHERALRLDTDADGAWWAALRASLPPVEPSLEISDPVIAVRHPAYQFKLDRLTGQCSLLDGKGGTMVSAFGPHMGRVLTINDLGKQRDGEKTQWRGELLREVAQVKTAAQKTSDGVLVSVSGNYPRPGVSHEAIEGECRLLFRPSGVIEVDYHYVPVNASGAFVETGLALAVPPAQSEFRWLGQGPYAGYPGKDRLNEYGLFHLNREDLYFPGNRRGVEMAFLANPSGAGVLMAGTNLTVSVDHLDDSTVFSQIAMVPGQGSDKKIKGENVDNQSEMKAGSLKNISGQFELLPLSTNWPAALGRWFGSPAQSAELHQAFYHSYDQ
jgi:beta-galactosidase